ncbi:bacteriocin immunity protein [Clostridium thermobutyricum]|uniref:bacteriocin immunity protein n=1 Tax=uncultured Clostridium sp. TaxID=59620 RepID=UPI00258A59E5|nr:bacteriocin immunity protein [uncultured Clostridium sp.]
MIYSLIIFKGSIMKKLNKKYYELISELEKSLNDFEVKEDKNLTKILTEYKDKIEKGS